jgi:hypothetical protein
MSVSAVLISSFSHKTKARAKHLDLEDVASLALLLSTKRKGYFLSGFCLFL